MEKWREDLYLQHYGVKGMKWGKRKAPSFINNERSTRKDPYYGVTADAVDRFLTKEKARYTVQKHVRDANKKRREKKKQAIKNALSTPFRMIKNLKTSIYKMRNPDKVLDTTAKVVATKHNAKERLRSSFR